MSNWLAESIDDVSSPYDKARFEAGYAVVKDQPKSRERPTERSVIGIREDDMNELKVGDKVRHTHRFHQHTPGTVIQVGGGSDGLLTEVYWPDNGDALWHTTTHLSLT